MSDPVRQRYSLGIGKGLTSAPGGAVIKAAKGGFIKKAPTTTVTHKKAQIPAGFKKHPSC